MPLAARKREMDDDPNPRAGRMRPRYDGDFTFDGGECPSAWKSLAGGLV
jgi:hypothetical protein